MEKLEKIYHKLDALQQELGDLIGIDPVTASYELLKKEEDLQQKWMPLMLPFILLVMAFMAWFTAAYESIVGTAGIALITIGALLMVYCFQIGRIPVSQYNPSHDMDQFVKVVQEKVGKRKHFWAVGVTIYLLSLTVGLHLLIFGVDSLVGKGGELGVFYGCMFGLTGYATGNMYLIHHQKYGAMLKQLP